MRIQIRKSGYSATRNAVFLLQDNVLNCPSVSQEFGALLLCARY